MRKIIQRLIIFFVGIPLLVSVVVLLPQKNHLVLNLAIVVFTVLGALEFRNMLARKNLVISLTEAALLGAAGPAAWVLVISFGVSEFIVPVVYILGAGWLFVSRVFSGGEKLETCANRAVAGFAVMIYPGLFMSWLVRMCAFPLAATVIIVYFLIVFLNDSAAWLAGVLLGTGNRGYIAASPTKSIAGFIGGEAASVAVGILAVILFPNAFASKLLPPMLAGAILGFGGGIAAILGDLSESAIKRSVEVKDSGSLIIGRGGALDSLDSLAMAAPVFYILYRVLFGI